MIAHKDVVLALLGASAGLAGLVLVFLGFLISALGGFAPGTDPIVLLPYRRTALVAASAFGISIITVAATTWWLVMLRDSELGYGVCLTLFAAQLGLVAVSAGTATYQLVWKT